MDGQKWRVKRGFVKLHVMVDTQTMKIVALSATDKSVGDVTEFRSLLGQGMEAIGTKGGAGDTPYHSKDPGPDTLAGERGDGTPPRHPAYKNRLASGISTLAPPPSDRQNDPAAAYIVYSNAAYGSRDNVAACGCGSGHPAQDQRDGARQVVRGRVGHIGKGPSGRESRGHATGPAEPGGEEEN